jgi:arylamine N-acetyltransferase
MQLQDILNCVHQLSADEAWSVMEAARMRRDYMTRASLRVGDTVRFSAGPRRGSRQGTIIKINTKRYVVDCGAGGRWNVAPNLLTKVTVSAA